MRYLRLLGVALSMLASHASAQTRVDAAERAALPDSIAAKLRAEYVYPDVAERMAVAIHRLAAQHHYADIGDGHVLADRLRDDLRAISHDGHLWVGYHPEGARDEPELPSLADIRAEREAAALDNFGFRRAEQLAGNIGYLRFDIFAYPDLAAPRATAALSFLADTDALIIDLRENVGGAPDMVAFVASFFFDTRTHLNDLRYRRGDRLEQFWTDPHVAGQHFGGEKPLYILTSAKTFSGAEDFAYALQTHARAKVVGATTGGGAHPSREFRVTEHFTVAVPYARSVSPITGRDWEGVGVTPDLPTDAATALDVAYKDALVTVMARQTDAGHKQWLQALLDKLPK